MKVKKKSRILAIANQKGGVGKTTTAINIAACLAKVGKSVLLVDFDPQGNASTGLGVPSQSRGSGSYKLLQNGHPATLSSYKTKIDQLWLIPSQIDLIGFESELATHPKREFRLKESLEIWAYDCPFNYILIDCPPSLGLLTLNAFTAADGILVPLQCEFYALEGVSGLTRTVEMVRRRSNPSLRLHGIILTMYDRRNNLSEQVAQDTRDFFGEWVFETVIPRNVRLSEAPSFGMPVSMYDSKSSGSVAYDQLTTEFLRRDAVMIGRSEV